MRPHAELAELAKIFFIFLLVLASGCRDATPQRAPISQAPAPPRTQFMSFADARPIIEAHANELPPELKGKSGAELEAAWSRSSAQSAMLQPGGMF